MKECLKCQSTFQQKTESQFCLRFSAEMTDAQALSNLYRSKDQVDPRLYLYLQKNPEHIKSLYKCRTEADILIYCSAVLIASILPNQTQVTKQLNTIRQNSDTTVHANLDDLIRQQKKVEILHEFKCRVCSPNVYQIDACHTYSVFVGPAPTYLMIRVDHLRYLDAVIKYPLKNFRYLGGSYSFKSRVEFINSHYISYNLNTAGTGYYKFDDEKVTPHNETGEGRSCLLLFELDVTNDDVISTNSHNTIDEELFAEVLSYNESPENNIDEDLFAEVLSYNGPPKNNLDEDYVTIHEEEGDVPSSTLENDVCMYYPYKNYPAERLYQDKVHLYEVILEKINRIFIYYAYYVSTLN